MCKIILSIQKWKKEYGEKTLVLMQVGSFFEVYGLRENDGSISGSNISDFSQLCDMLIAKKSQKVDGKQVLMAGFGVSQIEKYIKKLQEAGYTIAIYTQDMQAKNTTRSLEEIISPGTYFSSDTRSYLIMLCVSGYIDQRLQIFPISYEHWYCKY